MGNNDTQEEWRAMSVADFYDASANTYHRQYERESLRDLSIEYPANYFRLELLLNSFLEHSVRRVIEVGVGEGTPLSTLAAAGMDVAGFDISQEMVSRSKAAMSANGLDPDKIILADVEHPASYAKLLRHGQYDALMAMGVMPHVQNDDQAILNMKAMIRPGGLAFIEFRNKLFSLFTFNRYTYEFIMDDLLSTVAPEIRDRVGIYLKSTVDMEKPPRRGTHYDDETSVGYDAIQANFHNPFEVSSMFKRLGFEDVELLWYHYHPGMPFIEGESPAAFRNESIALEHEPSGWRGLFLCSAFVVQARKSV
jgi:2-polyprenyl-3-methyl-5-hydroxy-6-metoxy-1,4-benzoquinol methylase